MNYLKPNKRFNEKLSRALKQGRFTEEDRVIIRAKPNPVILELMGDFGVTEWPRELGDKVAVCGKLLVRGVTENNPQLATIAYECLKVLALAAKNMDHKKQGPTSVDQTTLE
jgi:hypothetical protein